MWMWVRRVGSGVWCGRCGKWGPTPVPHLLSDLSFVPPPTLFHRHPCASRRWGRAHRVSVQSAYHSQLVQATKALACGAGGGHGSGAGTWPLAHCTVHVIETHTGQVCAVWEEGSEVGVGWGVCVVCVSVVMPHPWGSGARTLVNTALRAKGQRVGEGQDGRADGPRRQSPSALARGAPEGPPGRCRTSPLACHHGGSARHWGRPGGLRCGVPCARQSKKNACAH